MHVRSGSQNSEGKHSPLLKVVADGGACGQKRQAGSELRERSCVRARYVSRVSEKSQNSRTPHATPCDRNTCQYDVA
jgi:hypothetical protein